MVKKTLTILMIFLTLSFFVNLESTFGNVSAFPTGSITKAALPEIRADLPAIAYDGLVYVFGGYHDSWNIGQAEVFAYDPLSDSWTQKTSMSYPRWGAAATVYNDEAYVFGGYYSVEASFAVEAYNFTSDSWETKQSLPSDVFNQGLEAVTVGSKIYLFYGSSTYSYDPQTEEYTQLASAPFAKTWAECAYVNVNGEDRIYILGGYDLPNYDATDTCAYFRPAFDDWKNINAAPYAAYGTLRDNPVINGIIYYGYGQGQHDSSFYDYMYSYNPSTSVWTQLPSGVYPRDGVGCAVVGSKLYVIGGRSNWETGDGPIMSLDYNEEFDTALFSQPTLTVNPPLVRMYVNQSQVFTATTLGGTIPYSFTWFLNGTVVGGQNKSIFKFVPSSPGNYSLFAKVSDANGKTAQSNIVDDFIVYNQSQPDLLVPDWSNVNRDFFTLVPGGVEPVLTAANATDRSADFVADPFIYHENGLWYMFFEVHWISTDYSEIGLATSNNGFDWSYKQIVLSESFSLTYPYIFKWNGSYYLIPETYSQSEVRLYKATNFPYGWTYVTSILSEQSYNPVDSSVFRYNNMWWMFTSSESDLGYLYYSYNLTDRSAWHMHPMSPINTDSMKVRGAGRAVVFDNDHIIRLTQELYGEGVRAFQVDTLNTTYYAEHEVAGSPLVEATDTSVWNAQAMHTVNPWWSGNGWVAAVDGAGYDGLWAIGIYMTPLQPSISPTAVRIDVGQSQKFTSIAGGGRPSYAYQWYYSNGTAISGATTSSLDYKANFTGTYNIYLNVTDNLNYEAKSNLATLYVYSQQTVLITPTKSILYYGQSQTFSSSITGGLAPYTYQWYINNTAVPQATYPNWTFTPRANGNYIVHLNVTDSLGSEVKSNIAGEINVYSVYLMIYSQASYSSGEQVSLKVTVLNQQNPKLETSLALTITGPAGYSFYDFQPINVSANSVNEYSFNWVVPNFDGTYIIEASLVPTQLTAYDAKWVEVSEQNNGLSKENILWMQTPYDLLDKTNVNNALQQITDSKFTSIALYRAAWDHNGNALPMDGIADSVYQQFLSTVKGYNSNLKVYVCNYGGAWISEGYGVESPDVRNPDVRNTMASAVTHELGLGFDGYIDDTEGWIGTDQNIIDWWNQMESTCKVAGKLGGVYFGIDSNSLNWQTHASILKSLSADLLVIRFYPIGNNADGVYQWVKNNINRPWMPQVRTASINNEGESIQSSINFYNKEFAKGAPSSFRGFTLWAYGYTTSADWKTWNDWNMKNLLSSPSN